MDMEYLALIAGVISRFIFIGSHVPMLLKAYRTHDLRSYSRLNLILINVGNLVYWLYLVSLPPGLVWLLHIFYTISSGVLLVMYCQRQSCNFKRPL